MTKLPKIINASQLANKLYPNNKNAKVALNAKLKEINYNKITDEDKEKIIEELQKAIAEIKRL